MSIQDQIIPSIKRRAIKVCIAVPARDMVHAHFAFCLQELVKYNADRNINTFVEFNLGTLVCNQREKLALTALEHDATHILWLDSDMMFPKNTCEILLGHDLPFIACNYSTRALPLKAVAYTEMYNWDSGISKDASGIVHVAGVGFGCVLLNTSVLIDIPRPWFPITYCPESDDYLGEDMNFCQKLQEAGYMPAVDCDLSKHIFHVGSSAFTWNKAPVDTDQQ